MILESILDYLFQLTTSQGGRRISNNWRYKYTTFQLTTSQGGRPLLYYHNYLIYLFQLTTSQGGRPFSVLPPPPLFVYFNSRPHKEVDLLPRSHPQTLFLFQLTTSQGGRHYVATSASAMYDISTHDLTRRST